MTVVVHDGLVVYWLFSSIKHCFVFGLLYIKLLVNVSVTSLRGHALGKMKFVIVIHRELGCYNCSSSVIDI